MTLEEFEDSIAAIMRVHGVGMTADLTDELVVYWTGDRLAYVLIMEAPTGNSYAIFNMDNTHWMRWQSWLEAWVEAPTFSVRPEVRDWVAEGIHSNASEEKS